MWLMVVCVCVEELCVCVWRGGESYVLIPLRL